MEESEGCRVLSDGDFVLGCWDDFLRSNVRFPLRCAAAGMTVGFGRSVYRVHEYCEGAVFEKGKIVVRIAQTVGSRMGVDDGEFSMHMMNAPVPREPKAR